METVALPPSDLELNLLTDWGALSDRSRLRHAAVYSVLGHVAAIILLAVMPADVMEQQPTCRAPLITPLVAPPELTQRAPNKQKVSKEFDVVDALERPKVQIPQGAPSTTRPRTFRPTETPQTVPVRPTAPLPSGVFGPVQRWALRRFAAICRSVAIGPPWRGFTAARTK